MNYLAHAYLSFGHPEILTGNMISDFVKGKKKFDYSTGIQKGIMLHRMIDAFTDSHEATKQARQFFKPAVGAYSGAFVDVAYDHFLANDTNEFTDESLHQFSLNTYSSLYANEENLPEKFKHMLPYMSTQNWLYNYKKMHGIGNSFAGLVRRAAYLQSSEPVFEAFQKNYTPLQECYQKFFPSIKEYAFNKLNELLLQ